MTGPVGGGSHFEYGATGDVVNTAARLQSEARIGSVLVGPTARAQVSELFHWSDPTAVELRGKDEVLDVAEAAGPRGDAPRARRLPGRGAPLVGRNRELATALGELDRLAGGAGVAIVIEGEAGSGRPGSSRPSVNGHAPALPGSTPHAPRWARPRRTRRSRSSSPRGGGHWAAAAARRIWCLPGATPPARRWPSSPATRCRRSGSASPRFRLQAASWRPRRASPPSSDPPLDSARSSSRSRTCTGPTPARSGRWSGWSRFPRPSRSRSSSRRAPRRTPARPLRSTASHMGTTSSGSARRAAVRSRS